MSLRITYKMMTSKYTDNLNKQSIELDRLNTQVSTGRAFSRTSEDTSAAIRGYQIRKNISKVEGYQDNIKFAQDFITNTESSLSQIEGSLSDAMEKILQGMNGTQNQGDRTILANEIRTIQDQMLETLNTNVTDTYIFGGSNSTDKPFTVDETTGKLLYNGIDLDTMISDGTDTVYNELAGDSLYVDIGLGVEFDASDNVNRNTVFNYSTPGVSFVGVGTTDVDGVPISNNVYNLLEEIATELEKNDTDYSPDRINSLYGQFLESKQLSYQKTTEIGSKTNYLDFMTDRYETQMLNLQTRQTDIEGIDTAEAYINFSSQQVAYQAALQMGTSIIQQSVFDYMS
jgi:flagellar hook-associated protein 3 FlgL